MIMSVATVLVLLAMLSMTLIVAVSGSTTPCTARSAFDSVLDSGNIPSAWLVVHDTVVSEPFTRCPNVSATIVFRRVTFTATGIFDVRCSTQDTTIVILDSYIVNRTLNMNDSPFVFGIGGAQGQNVTFLAFNLTGSIASSSGVSIVRAAFANSGSQITIEIVGSRLGVYRTHTATAQGDTSGFTISGNILNRCTMRLCDSNFTMVSMFVQDTASPTRSMARLAGFSEWTSAANIQFVIDRCNVVHTMINAYVFVHRIAWQVVYLVRSASNSETLLEDLHVVARHVRVVGAATEHIAFVMISQEINQTSRVAVEMKHATVQFASQGWLVLQAASRLALILRTGYNTVDCSFIISDSDVLLSIESGYAASQFAYANANCSASSLNSVFAALASPLGGANLSLVCQRTTMTVDVANGTMFDYASATAGAVVLMSPSKQFGALSINVSDSTFRIHVISYLRHCLSYELQHSAGGILVSLRVSLGGVIVNVTNTTLDVYLATPFETLGPTPLSMSWTAAAPAIVTLVEPTAASLSAGIFAGIPNALIAQILPPDFRVVSVSAASIDIFVRNVTSRARSAAAREVFAGTPRVLCIRSYTVQGITSVRVSSSSFVSYGASTPVERLLQFAPADDGALVAFVNVMAPQVEIDVRYSTARLVHAVVMHNVSSSSPLFTPKVSVQLFRNVFLCESLSSDGATVLVGHIAGNCTLITACPAYPEVCSSISLPLSTVNAALQLNELRGYSALFPLLVASFPWSAASRVTVLCNSWNRWAQDTTSSISRMLPRSRSGIPNGIARWMCSSDYTTSESTTPTLTAMACTIHVLNPLQHTSDLLHVSSFDVEIIASFNMFVNHTTPVFDVVSSWGTVITIRPRVVSSSVESLLSYGCVITVRKPYQPIGVFDTIPVVLSVAVKPSSGCMLHGSALTSTVTFWGAEPPSPEYLREASSYLVATVGSVVSLAGGGTSSALSYQRMMLVLQLSVCEFSDSEPLSVSDSPTRIGFGPLDGGYLRGAVIGDMLIWFGVWHGIVAVSLVRLYRRGEAITRPSLQVESRYAGLPGIMGVPLMMLLPPVVASSVALLTNGYAPYDYLIGCLGVGIPTFCCTWLIHRTMVSFHCVARKSVEMKALLDMDRFEGSSIRSRVRRGFRWFFAPRIEWIVLPTARPYLSHCYSSIFEEYDKNRHWFFVVESAVAVATGVIGGIRPATESGCDTLKWVNLAVNCAATLSIFLWGFRSPHGNFNYALNNLASLACAVCLSLGEDGVSDFIAMIINLLAIVSTLFGFVSLALRLYRRWKHFVSLNANSSKIARRLIRQGRSNFLRFIARRLLLSSGRPLSFLNDPDPALQRTLVLGEFDRKSTLTHSNSIIHLTASFDQPPSPDTTTHEPFRQPRLPNPREEPPEAPLVILVKMAIKARSEHRTNL